MQGSRMARKGSDLMAFKARFRDAELPAGRMPLVAFPGGYGGLVQSDCGSTTFSLCIRRDALQACRARNPGLPAGEAVFAYIRERCGGVRATLGRASRESGWLAAGPIRPGTRRFYGDGMYAVGNAAGEAHPVIAEGIGMALQSAALLCEALIECPDAPARPEAARQAARQYEKRWRASFGMRVTASSLFARLAMQPAAAGAAELILKRAPSLLTLGARLSGKAA
jgi:flavin-dependent dehydrogenase